VNGDTSNRGQNDSEIRAERPQCAKQKQDRADEKKPTPKRLPLRIHTHTQSPLFRSGGVRPPPS